MQFCIGKKKEAKVKPIEYRKFALITNEDFRSSVYLINNWSSDNVFVIENNENYIWDKTKSYRIGKTELEDKIIIDLACIYHRYNLPNERPLLESEKQ